MYSDATGRRFRSVVVITFALHAKGHGFEPRRNLIFYFKQKEAAFKGWVKDKTEEAKPIFRDAVDTCLKTPASCCLKDEQVPAAASDDDVHKRITWTKELQARALDKIMTYKVYGHVF